MGIIFCSLLITNQTFYHPMKNEQYFVYILTNKNNTVLYTGVTSDLQKRIDQHREGIGSSFTRKYKVHKLVYFESTSDILSAIEREKQIKAGSRIKKLELINNMNPTWKDLSENLF